MALFVAQGKYNRQKAGISVAIAMSVLIPFMICGACFIFKLRENIGFQRSTTQQQPQQQKFPATFNEESRWPDCTFWPKGLVHLKNPNSYVAL